MRTIHALFFCSLLLLFSMPVLAADSAQEYFSQGVKAASAGDYKSALTGFLQAREQGMDKPVLDYNLGVAYYRLGRYPEARKVFTRLLKKPRFTPVAYFNLGLIANKTGDDRSAIDWFLRAYQNTEDEKLKALAATALKRLGVDVENSPVTKKWSGFAAVNVGHDSNVKLANEDLVGVFGESDSSLEIMGVGNYWLRGGREDGVRLSFSANVQKYQSLSNYDFSQFQLGLSRFGRLAGWGMRFTGSWNESYLGGNNYQRIFGGETRGRYGLGNGKYLRLRYRLNYITATGTAFESLEGWRHQLRAGMQLKQGAHHLRVYYQLDLNDRSDRMRATGFTSFSPTRHALRALAYLRLGGKWKGRLDARYRFSGYNDATTDTAVVASPVTREDTQLRLGARVGRSFARYWDVEGQYIYYDNSSNIAVNSYKRSVVSLGISRFF